MTYGELVPTPSEEEIIRRATVVNESRLGRPLTAEETQQMVTQIREPDIAAQQVGMGFVTDFFEPMIKQSNRPHWEKAIKKEIFTLCIDNYEPAIRELTWPLMRRYADKIGASFHVITERKFPDWPITYEKLQIFDLAKEHGNDWNFFFDSDALISPEMFDPTDHLHKDTVMHNGKDMTGVRWKYDQYFRRDGRHLGSCNWFALASDWCLDFWRPLDDLTPEEAISRIFITIDEHNSGCCKKDHLIDDYTLSRNVARFGLKHMTFQKLCGDLGWKSPRTISTHKGDTLVWGEQDSSPFLFHVYNLPTDKKLRAMLDVLSLPRDRGGWQLMSQDQRMAFEQKWGIK